MADVVAVGLRLPAELYEVVRLYAFEHRLSINAVLALAIRQWVEGQKGEGQRDE